MLRGAKPHFEEMLIDSYVLEIARWLSPEGKAALYRTCKTIARALQSDPIYWFEIKCEALYSLEALNYTAYADNLTHIVEFCRDQSLRSQPSRAQFPPEGTLVTMTLDH